MQYYPARVAKQGKVYLGVGIHEESLTGVREDYFYNTGVFFRYGLPNNFDIGLQYTLLSCVLDINVRKQFDLSSDLIHSITLDIGGGKYFVDLPAQFCIMLSLIRSDIFLTFGFKKYKMLGWGMFFDVSTAYRNEFLIKISTDLKGEICNTILFLYFKAVQEYNYYNTDFKTYMTYIERTGWDNKQIGIGFSLYVDLF